MPTYISLCNFTDQGIRTIKEAPNRAQKADELARELGCSLTAYPTIGPYDLVFVLEAPDDKVATRFFLAMGAAGNIRTTTLRAIPREEFLEIASSLQ